MRVAARILIALCFFAAGACHHDAPPAPAKDGIGALTKKGKDAEDAAKAAAAEAEKRREAEKASE